VPTKIGEACHVWLPAATSGEANLTSMNGERRMRLTEKYMDPPGQAMPDCLIAARIANNMERVLREQGKGQYADKFNGFDWKTEEDAFMDGYHQHEKGGEFVTYARLRAMGTNGFQEPAVGLEGIGTVAAGTGTTTGLSPSAPAESERIIGTKRLFADGKFNSKDGKATFLPTQWRGLEAPGKEDERRKWPFLVNNGRTNVVWQSAYLDQDNEFVMDRMPYPLIQMNPDDMAELKLKQGDLVEVYNDNGSTQAMVYPTPTAKRKQTFMLFANPAGVQGNVVSPGVNEFVIPNYKQTWGNIRKIADAPEGVKHLSFKSLEYTA
jgi:arsenite oxidase large subunit